MITYSRGVYKALITEQAFEEAAKGTPMFVLGVRPLKRRDVQGNLHDCTPNEREIRQTLANDAGVNILLSDLRTIGVQITDLAQLHPGSPNCINLIGKEIDLVCEHELFEGNLVERWSVARKPVTLDTIAALQAKFGHLLRPQQAPPAPTP